MPADDSKPTRLERPSTPGASDPAPAGASAGSSGGVGPRYAGGEEIARGGMGRVIEATDTVLQRVVAIKEALTDEPELLKRFARETRITARLEHPSIVPLYDAGGGAGGEPPFYVMRRVSGQPLEDLIADARTLDARLALLPNLLAATQAIAHAHRRGVIHRDLKPANILVGELGETVVIDWGLAKVIGEPQDDGDVAPLAGDSLHTRIGTIAGTPGFMSPEQARGEENGPPADVWALGACLYFLLARQPPHHRSGSTGDDLIAYVAARPVMPIGQVVRGVPAELAAIVDKALAFDVADRYPDAAALAEELRRFLAGQLVAAHEYSVRERIVRWAKRNRTAVAVASLALLVLGVVSTYAIVRVIRERDIANAERATALAAQRDAEDARKRAQERADAELIARARSVVLSDPVRAAAVLGMLSPSSARLTEARGVLQSARMHGANVFGVQGDSSAPNSVEVSPRGDRAFVLRRGDVLETFSLPATGEVKTTPVPETWHACWVEGGRRILLVGTTETRLFDPATQTLTPLHLERVKAVQPDAEGTTILALTYDRRVGWLDTKTGSFSSFTTVPADVPTSIDLTLSGAFAAVVAGAQVRIFTRDSALVSDWELPTAKGLTVASSATSRFAVSSGVDVFSINAAAIKPVWEPMAVKDAASLLMLGVPYFDGEALRVRAATALYSVSKDHRRPIMPASSTNVALVGPAQTLFLDEDKHVTVGDSEHTQTFALPGSLESAVVGGRRGIPYGIVSVRGATYILDLTYQAPRPIGSADIAFAIFVDDHSAIAGTGVELSWLDIDSGQATPLELASGESCCRPATFIDSSGSPLIVYPEYMVKPHVELYAFAGPRTPGYRFTGEDIAGLSYGRRVAIVDRRTLQIIELGKAPLLVFTFPEEIEQWSGHDDEVLATSATKLVRIRVSTASIIEERAIAPAQKGSVVAFGDRLLLARGKVLSSFDHPATPLVTLPQEVTHIGIVDGGLVTTYDDQSGAYVSLGPEPHAYPLGQAVLAAAHQHVIVDSGVGLELVELPSMMRSLLPIKRRGAASPLSISKAEDQVLESGTFRPWLWTLPTSAGDLAAEVRATTNAKERDGVVVWPWQ